MKHLLLLASIILVWSCGAPKDNSGENVSHSPTQLSLQYATGFDVDYYKGYKIVTVTKPYMAANDSFEYVLTENPENLPENLKDLSVIKIPVERMVCTSTTHIPLLDYLNDSDALVGFPTTDYISSEKMRKRIEDGSIEELGVDKELNLEKLVELEAQMVMAYSIGGDYGQFRKIEQLDIPVVLNGEYMEEHPLGRAEWIKFMAAFLNKERLADSIFNAIATNYESLKNKVPEDKGPTVISGVVYGDTWYMPGGRNYAAKLINDAGGDFLWKNDSTKGFLELSFEAVYEKGHTADKWVGVASFESLSRIAEADNRYADFDAFKNKEVYSNNIRKGAKGGSEFLELGYLRPDIILSDLIKIFHPELMEDHELYFHHRLPQ